MATAEDVFPLYERKRSFTSGEVVQPVTIGDQSVPCRFRVKCYIRPGEECPICLEKIMLKKDAFLTGCGHSFHRGCLFKTFQAKWNENPFSVLRCPMCRCGLGFPLLLEKYRSLDDNHYSKNHLDELENFWLTKDFHMPYYCILVKKGRRDPVHYLGMKPSCTNCSDYIHHG